MTNPDHTGTPAATEYATVYLVFELSKATWKLGLLLPGSKKLSRYAIPGGDLKALTELLTKARTKWRAAANRFASFPAMKPASMRIGCIAGSLTKA